MRVAQLVALLHEEKREKEVFLHLPLFGVFVYFCVFALCDCAFVYLCSCLYRGGVRRIRRSRMARGRKKKEKSKGVGMMLLIYKTLRKQKIKQIWRNRSTRKRKRMR